MYSSYASLLIKNGFYITVLNIIKGGGGVKKFKGVSLYLNSL